MSRFYFAVVFVFVYYILALKAKYSYIKYTFRTDLCCWVDTRDEQSFLFLTPTPLPDSDSTPIPTNSTPTPV